MMTCTRCEGSGFLNIEQVDDETLVLFDKTGNHLIISDWISNHKEHDVSVCDCCGDGVAWYGTPGEHYNSEDLPGDFGPYAYNGGYCECH